MCCCLSIKGTALPCFDVLEQAILETTWALNSEGAVLPQFCQQYISFSSLLDFFL